MAGIFKNIWDKDKDGNRKSQRSFLRFFIVATSFFVLMMFIKRDNVIRWIQAGITIRDQKHQIEHLQKRIDGMNAHINNLTTDRDSLEKFAREQYFFAEHGEDVYLVDE
ncbi:MAG: septum formation initiator family protein [Candidatus Cryptobacteroides sp.]|nr:septum formation initiator family protein [Candidatus Cryptobacteroides sp.]